MKNTLKPGTKRALAVIKSAKSSEQLKHLLCPMEQAILNHHFKPFVYNYNGVPIYLSHHVMSQFMADITHKVTFMAMLIEREALSRKIPLKHRETFYDPGIILALSPRLRNRLCRLQCYTLFEVMKKGRTFFGEEEKFSKQAMQTLGVVFAKYKCTKLFK